MKTNTLIIDNNDSFTYNIVETLRKNQNVISTVVESSELDIEAVESFDKIIFSPGPGKPADFPVMEQVLEVYKNKKSILGICLGHQLICRYFGANLIRLKQVYHGQEQLIRLNPKNKLYRNLPAKITVGLYHSWMVDKDSLPECLGTSAMSEQNVLMSVSHNEFDIHGVQFHPESFLTKYGREILNNFINS